MKHFIINMKYGWHQGKGSKYLRKKEYKKALKHCLISLKYAKYFGDQEVLAIEMESVARAYFYLGDYNQALKYAEKGHDTIQEYKNTASVYNECNTRVVNLIKKINLAMKKNNEI